MVEDLKLFGEDKVRSYYDENSEHWFFSIIDIVSILTESKLKSTDGKKYNTDCADVETLLRIIQSIPSKKAEPVKQWLAKVGYERMKEMVDPSTAIDRARETYKKLGRSEKWIQQRMTGQETRNKLTE